jgi:hypothetical protein
MRLALAVTDTQKAQIHTQLAETRAVEVETMANEGKTEHAAITAARLAKQLEQANSAIAKVESTSGIPPEETVTPPQETIIPPQETVTPPEETVTPPEETVTPPEETVTPPQETTTVTPPEETVTPPQETVTPPEETTTVTPPEETVTPPDTTKGKTTSAKKTERFKKSLETSTSKSLTALENAKEKSSQYSKADWQRAINTITEKGKDKHDNQGWSDNKTRGENKSDNKTWGGWQPNTVSPNQSQPYPWK